ncbi:uncharacterized protein METZ01_LOCUS325466 [marine metagenome]|uniref:Uncharacterized protein n=1 Tax=marine metagenome TaxID=408172 RepID=A0A382PKV9_9ZZZZ
MTNFMLLGTGIFEPAKTRSTDSGNPSTASQQWARVLTDYPVRYWLAGEVRNPCQSSGPLLGT